jgi:metallo-beta-lactamase family protein
VPGGPLRIGPADVGLTPVGPLAGYLRHQPERPGRTLAFSGDVGRQANLLMPPPQALASANVLRVESAEGNQRQPAGATEAATAALARTVRETVQRGGKVLLPSFAVGRARALLLLLLLLLTR